MADGVGNIGGTFGSFIPVVLYAAIQLGMLAFVSQGHWRALFRKVGWRDVLLMIGFALVSIAVSLVVGFLLVNLTDTTSNAAVAGLAEQGTAAIVLFYLRTLIQLLGEEVMTILPFLALPYIITKNLWVSTGAHVLNDWTTFSLSLLGAAAVESAARRRRSRRRERAANVVSGRATNQTTYIRSDSR